MGLHGDLSDLSFAELLQMLNLGRKSGTLQVRFGEFSGTVHMVDGEVVHATVKGTPTPEQAIFQLLGATLGEFEFDTVCAQVKRTITSSTDSLLLEGMKRMDEWQELDRTIGANVPLRIAASDIEARMDTLPAGPKELLRLVDGKRSIVQIVKMSGLDPVKALMAVTELVASGVVERCSEPAMPSNGGGPIHVAADGGSPQSEKSIARLHIQPLKSER